MVTLWLKQSPRQWYLRFDQFMEKIGYVKSKYDVCVYFKGNTTASPVYLVLYVDDMLVASKDRHELNRLKDQLKAEFEMKDLGPARTILGIDITRNRKEGRTFLSQEAYVNKIFEKFRMADAKPMSTPIAQHFKLSVTQAPKNDEEREYMDKVPYAK